MPKAWSAWSFVVLVLFFSGNASASIPDFFDELFRESSIEYADFRNTEFGEFCSEHGLDPSYEKTREAFLRIYFVHDLLTTVGASNCARGGFLKIPYFWHWVEPNPRHAIVFLPNSVKLCESAPPAPYGRYKTRADIDRVPALFLGDLVSETPKYSHPDCGTFFTFGWCSEREMAYTAIMTAWGFQAKIRQSGIHTYSVVWNSFTRSDGTETVLEAYIDNTFDVVFWRKVSNTLRLAQWRNDIGAGTQIRWYNKKAQSHKQMESLGNTLVVDGSKTRIRRMIFEALSCENQFFYSGQSAVDKKTGIWKNSCCPEDVR